MSKEILELFKKQFDDHFGRELIMVQAVRHARDDKLMTQQELYKLNLFIHNHIHAQFAQERFDSEGGQMSKAYNKLRSEVKKDVDKLGKEVKKSKKR
jgi:hypothetical protein